jgi:hypothetical protein
MPHEQHDQQCEGENCQDRPHEWINYSQ